MPKVTPVKIDEFEWLASHDLNRPFRFIFPIASTRRLRLFACAACENLRRLFADPAVFAAVDAAADWADGLISRSDVLAARRHVDWTVGSSYSSGNSLATFAADRAASTGRVTAREAAWSALRAGPAYRFGGWEDKDQADLLRDIFGNPFRPAAFAPEWRTADAVGLAQAMYSSRDFAAMPILADALEEAGCDSPDILAHGRGPGPHVRGCWVVDLVLGKS